MDELDSTTENEIEMFSKINHENIVRYFDHFHLNISYDEYTFLITEYCQVSNNQDFLLLKLNEPLI